METSGSGSGSLHNTFPSLWTTAENILHITIPCLVPECYRNSEIPVANMRRFRDSLCLIIISTSVSPRCVFVFFCTGRWANEDTSDHDCYHSLTQTISFSLHWSATHAPKHRYLSITLAHSPSTYSHHPSPIKPAKQGNTPAPRSTAAAKESYQLQDLQSPATQNTPGAVDNPNPSTEEPNKK